MTQILMRFPSPASFSTGNGHQHSKHCLATTSGKIMNSAALQAYALSSQYINEPWTRNDVNGMEGGCFNQGATAGEGHSSNDSTTTDEELHGQVLADATSFFGVEEEQSAHDFALVFGSRSMLDRAGPVSLDPFKVRQRYIRKGYNDLSSTMLRLLVSIFPNVHTISGVRKVVIDGKIVVSVTNHAKKEICTVIKDSILAIRRSNPSVPLAPVPPAPMSLETSAHFLHPESVQISRKRRQINDDTANASRSKRPRTGLTRAEFLDALSLCELPEHCLKNHPMLTDAIHFFEDEAFAMAFVNYLWQERRGRRPLPFKGASFPNANEVSQNAIVISGPVLGGLIYIFYGLDKVPGFQDIHLIRHDEFVVLAMPLAIRDQIRTEVSKFIEARQRRREAVFRRDQVAAQWIVSHYNRQFADHTRAYGLDHKDSTHAQVLADSKGSKVVELYNHLDPSEHTPFSPDALNHASSRANPNDLNGSHALDNLQVQYTYEQPGINQNVPLDVELTPQPNESDWNEFQANAGSLLPIQFSSDFHHQSSFGGQDYDASIVPGVSPLPAGAYFEEIDDEGDPAAGTHTATPSQGVDDTVPFNEGLLALFQPNHDNQLKFDTGFGPDVSKTVEGQDTSSYSELQGLFLPIDNDVVEPGSSTEPIYDPRFFQWQY